MGYLMSIKHDDGFENVIEIKSDNVWKVEFPVSNTWRWAKGGLYKDAGLGQFSFRDKNDKPVFRLELFEQPPKFGATGTAAFDTTYGPANAKWLVLASEHQLAEVKQQMEQFQKEINDIYYQTMIDVVGCIDPTPVSDTVGAVNAFKNGQNIEGCLSLVSVVPYLGDLLGKSAKGALLLARLNRAKEKFKILLEVLRKLQKRLNDTAQASKAKILAHSRKKLRSRISELSKITPDVYKAAEKGGLNPKHLNNWKIFCTQCEPPKLAILRDRNPASLKWEGRADCTPKPTEVKLKTAKKGEWAGLVVYPRPASLKDLEDIKKLKAKGYKFKPDGPGGVLINPKGQKVHGDVDKMGVYNIETNGKTKKAQAWKGDRHNDAVDMQNQINKDIYEGIKNDQHGGQDFFYGLDMNGKPMTKYDDVAQIWSMGRHFEPDETFTIIQPDGVVKNVDFEGLNRVYAQFGIKSPYTKR